MKAVLKNSVLVTIASLMLSACGSGGGGGGSTAAATPSANGAGGVGGLAVMNNNVGNIGPGTWSGTVTMTANPLLFNSFLAQNGQCLAGQCGLQQNSQFLNVTISTMPNSGCVNPRLQPGSLPGPVYFSITTMGGPYGSNGITHCGRGFLNAQNSVAINWLPRVMPALGALPGAPYSGVYPQNPGAVAPVNGVVGQIPGQVQGAAVGLQLTTARLDQFHMGVQIYLNGALLGTGTLQGYSYGGVSYAGGYQGGYPVNAAATTAPRFGAYY